MDSHTWAQAIAAGAVLILTIIAFLEWDDRRRRDRAIRLIEELHGGAEPPDGQLDLEFGYTTWEHSCRDLHSVGHQCRRPYGHDGDHAAGFGNARARWSA